MYVCVYVCMYICIYVCMYLYVCMYVFIYIYWGKVSPTLIMKMEYIIIVTSYHVVEIAGLDDIINKGSSEI